MANLSVQGLDPQLSERLKAEAERRGVSVNALVMEFVKAGLGFSGARPRRPVYTDLDHLAGTWTAQQAEEFLRAQAAFEQIDEEIWK